MEGLRQHFRLHGAVHAWWVIAVLVLVIAALLLNTPNGDVVNAYISFASSLASLLLAVVAMFYAFISNQSSSETVADLRAYTTQMSAASTSVSAASKDISDRIASLISDFSDIRPRVEQIQSHLEGIGSPVAPSLNERNISEQTLNGLFKVEPSRGVKVALYGIEKAYRLGIRRIDVDKIYQNSELWRNYMQGVHDFISITHPCGIDLKKIHRENKVGGFSEYYYEIQEIPESVLTQIRDVTTEEKLAGSLPQVEAINVELASQI